MGTWRMSLHTRLLCALGLNIRRVLCFCFGEWSSGWAQRDVSVPYAVNRSDAYGGRRHPSSILVDGHKKGAPMPHTHVSILDKIDVDV